MRFNPMNNLNKLTQVTEEVQMQKQPPQTAFNHTNSPNSEGRQTAETMKDIDQNKAMHAFTIDSGDDSDTDNENENEEEYMDVELGDLAARAQTHLDRENKRRQTIWRTAGLVIVGVCLGIIAIMAISLTSNLDESKSDDSLSGGLRTDRNNSISNGTFIDCMVNGTAHEFEVNNDDNPNSIDLITKCYDMSNQQDVITFLTENVALFPLETILQFLDSHLEATNTANEVIEFIKSHPLNDNSTQFNATQFNTIVDHIYASIDAMNTTLPSS